MEEIEKEDIIYRLQEIATSNLLDKNEIPQVLKIDGTYPFEDIKSLSRELFRTKDKIYFIIDKNITIKGKITNHVNEFLNKVSLIKVIEETIGQGENEQVVRILKFFNERIDKRQKIVDSFDQEFYIYKMVSNGREYLIFSLEQLELEEYTITGMEVEVGDLADIGNYTRINLKLPIIFANNCYNKVIKFKTHEDLFKVLPPFTEDDLMSYLFSNKEGIYFKHPRPFERLIASFIFSAKYDSSPYPLHLLIIGQAGSGKSKVMECLHWKFGENNEITDGSCSTIKSLIPSFRSTINIQTGDLIKSNRLCCVDEFLRILVRIPSEEREPQLAALNPLLEHKIRNFGSGNYSFKGKMTAKLLTASNPVYGTSDMIRLCNKIDKSFLSRLLVYYQSKEHFEYIAKKDESDLTINTFLLPNELFISIYDYLTSFKAKFDKTKVNEIYQEGLSLLGQDDVDNPYNDIRSIYLARYKHHLYCLMDGVIKTRCLYDRDTKYEAIDKDYIILKEIYNIIINNLIGVKVYGGDLLYI